MHRSLYYQQKSKLGSWRQAEGFCKKFGAHLWSINSYTEGNTIFDNFGIYNFETQLSTYSKGTVKLFETTLIFIGLRRAANQVRYLTQIKGLYVANYM